MFIDNIIKPTLIKDWHFCSSMINPFRREKIERMPEKKCIRLYYCYSRYCAGIVAYVSPLASGYTDNMSCARHASRYTLNLRDINAALPLKGLTGCR